MARVSPAISVSRRRDRAVRILIVLFALLAAAPHEAIATGGAGPQLLSTTAPLVVLWDTAHTGSNPTSASHGLLRSDQTNATFVLKTSGEVTSSDLAAVNLYVLVEPDSKDPTPAEIAAVQEFMAGGGGLLVLTHTTGQSSGTNALLAGSGITQATNTTGGFVSTTDVTSHPITAGVGSFFVAFDSKSFDVVPPAVSCVRHSSQTIVAAADLGSHRIVAVGDEASFQNNGTPDFYYHRNNNQLLARNIFDWFRRAGSRGRLSLDVAIYGPNATVAIELTDGDLAAATSASVRAQSSRGDNEIVTLSAAGAGHFQGSLALTTAAVIAGNGRLSVADGSVITAVYHDLNNESGLPADVQTTAAVDGRAPTIRQVQIVRVAPFSARVSWQTDEPATARARFGLSASVTIRSVERTDLRTSHVLELRWLQPETKYFFSVESRDAHGNLRIENAGGAGFSFTTCRSRRADPRIRVLLLYADPSVAGVLDVESKLLADDRIAHVDRWDYHAVLPTLALLQAYDAVLIHAHLSSPNSGVVGDRLADFIESGGPVVALNQATVEPWAIGGRFRARGHGVFAVSNSYRENQHSTLGAIHVPSHPLLDDVVAFDGGAWSGRQSSVALTSGGACVADWSDGEPLVAWRIVGGTRLVGLNFFGPSSTVSPELWNAAGDGGRLMANALVWASRALECDAWAVPQLAAEPAFTRGTTNTLVWPDFAQAEQIELEWSRDGFATIAGHSGWVSQILHQWTAFGLADGQSYRFRLRGRNTSIGFSSYSNVVQSRQDATPPPTRVLALPAYSTTTRFSVAWTGSDAVSGLLWARLFYRRGAVGPFTQYNGLFTTSPIQFDSAQTGGDGLYGFYTIGTDGVGNQEAVPSLPDAQTTALTVVLAAPILNPEPPFTSGTTNRFSWSNVPGATHYYAQWSTSSAFSPLKGNTGWTTATSHMAITLADGKTYYFRVKCRNPALVQSGWSNAVSSCQDSLAPQSRILPLDPFTAGLTFTLDCSASDSGSGVKEVALRYRRGRTGSFKPWATLFTSGTLIFNVQLAGGAGVYQFYSIAKDQVGNTETAPPTPDAETTVELPLPPSTRSRRWTHYR